MKEEPRVPVVARLRLPDGREFDVHTEAQAQYAESQEFWWTEGNGACDCNRSGYLNEQHNLGLWAPHPPGSDDDRDLPCGDTIELLSLRVDGVEQLRKVQP